MAIADQIAKFVAETTFDAHVKSHFYMDLGIQEFRNYELL